MTKGIQKEELSRRNDSGRFDATARCSFRGWSARRAEQGTIRVRRVLNLKIGMQKQPLSSEIPRAVIQSRWVKHVRGHRETSVILRSWRIALDTYLPDAPGTRNCLWVIATLIQILRYFVTVPHDLDHPTLKVS